MIDKLTFRNIRPADLGWHDEAVEPDFDGVPEWMNLAEREQHGATYRQGRTTGHLLVKLDAGILSGSDPAKESEMLQRILFLLDLSLKSGSFVQEMVAVLEPVCPQLIWGRLNTRQGNHARAGIWNRSLLALHDGLMLEAFFWQDRLDAVSVTDLELTILNDELEGMEDTRKEALVREKVARLQLDPVPFALQCGFRAVPEKVEWSRGIEALEDNAEEEMNAGFRIVTAEDFTGADLMDLELDHFSAPVARR